MKYAIVESGGKQYKAVEGTTLQVDLLPLEVDEKVTLDSVLLIVDEENVSIGKPNVKGAKVEASVVGHEKGKKVIAFKYHPRKRYRLKKGHRQKYTRLLVETIVTE